MGVHCIMTKYFLFIVSKMKLAWIFGAYNHRIGPNYGSDLIFLLGSVLMRTVSGSGSGIYWIIAWHFRKIFF